MDITSGSLTPKIEPRELLYVSDLDGTLLDGEGKLPPDSIKRLNRLIDKGLDFTVATARNYDSAYPLLRGLNLKHPVILFNGVYLTDFHTGTNIFFSDFISPEMINKMIALVEPRDIDPFIYTYGNNHSVYYRSINNSGAQRYINSVSSYKNIKQVDEFIFSEYNTY